MGLDVRMLVSSGACILKAKEASASEILNFRKGLGFRGLGFMVSGFISAKDRAVLNTKKFGKSSSGSTSWKLKARSSVGIPEIVVMKTSRHRNPTP